MPVARNQALAYVPPQVVLAVVTPVLEAPATPAMAVVTLGPHTKPLER